VGQSGGSRVDAFPPTRQEIVNQISTCDPYREESVNAWELINSVCQCGYARMLKRSLCPADPELLLHSRMVAFSELRA
jgi:hypothetical protein